MKVRLLTHLALIILLSATVLALAGCASFNSNMADSPDRAGAPPYAGDPEANGNPEKAWWN